MTLLQEHSRQRQIAAWSSRLSHDSLHISEYQHLKGFLTNAQTAVYLNIRNDILWLWTRNPLVHVSISEILGRVKDKQCHPLAAFAHEWLARNGYINFGCLDLEAFPNPSPNSAKRKTVVIIGAGVSGLSTARQLQSLFLQFRTKWSKHRGEKLPQVVVLEGRKRIGGRVYSHALKTQVPGSLPHGLANTAEMGAQIITGFNLGNPLDAIIRGQLTLEYHLMKDTVTIYDFNGEIIDPKTDQKMNDLYNQLLEIAGEHGWKVTQQATMIAKQESVDAMLDIKQESPAIISGTPDFAQFDTTGHNLGTFLDQCVRRQNPPLSAQELRSLNWHYANLEYANAVNLNHLSLGGWDQDTGNEFDGRHSEVKGGYSQLPRALMKYPTPLDVKLGRAVKDICYRADGASQVPAATVHCENGEVFNADYVVSTLPLGVMKEHRITFNPPLPAWKTESIQRIGFGVLNKVVLVFDRVFWPTKPDMFGVANQSIVNDSLSPSDYAPDRGMFYLFWNCLKTAGVPVLVGVMAGDAARAAESMDDQVLVDMAVERLEKIFKLPKRPVPKEAIVTRWRKDRFARGSYSFMGVDSMPGDYDAMAARVGNLFFAGEATCGSYPATVHGAYLSGLRAASEVVEAMFGPIPSPVIG